MTVQKSNRRFDQLLQAMVTQPLPSEKPAKEVRNISGLTAQVMAILELGALRMHNLSTGSILYLWSP